MRHTYVRHDRTAGEQCQQVTPLGVASGARGELLCGSMASCSTWLGACGGDGRAGDPCQRTQSFGVGRKTRMH